MEKVKTPWFLPTEEIFSKLDTGPKGLNETEAQKRLDIQGLNELKKNGGLSFLELALKQFLSPLIFILISAAFLTAIIREWVSTFVILGAVLINAGLGLYREYKAGNILEKLVTYIKDRCRVVRDGNEKEIEPSLLVPGDLIKLSYGSRIPADARIVSLNNFKVDEAVLTGESAPEEKSLEPVEESALLADRPNMVYAGTMVVEGFASAVVTETGEDTEIGKIAEIVSKANNVATPIQKGISELSWYIFGVTILIVSVIFFLGILRGEDTITMLVLSAAVAVGAVPESLPIALTIILSVGAERIASKKGIVKKLAAAETLGSTTLVITDKTGTLTGAEMQLVDVSTTAMLLAGEDSQKKVLRLTDEQKGLLQLALSNLDLIVQNPEAEEKDWKFVGHPFEANIAKVSAMHGLSLRKPLLEEHILSLPFNSSHKFSVAKTAKNFIIMGAPDILLERSDLDKEKYLKIASWIEKASTEGKRLIALGTLSGDMNKKIVPDEIKNISFAGILSFFDPIREGVPKAIKDIETHGVRVVIATGDLKGTAISVAKSLGWEVKESEVLSGEDIRSISDEELSLVLDNIKIFARVTPEDKLRIGNLYKKKGEVVAMTGDGVNDSPALKSMDIGISLGSGSDVAQSASDLVLLDNNFETISMAIDEGRKILANIRKAFIYLMSNSLDEVFVVGGSLIANIALPINALQIIWVNLLTGSLPALAFAYDENLDKGAGKKIKDKKLMTLEVKILSFGLGTVTSLLIFLLYYFLLQYGIEVSVTRSVFFVCFSIYILVVAFSFKSLYRPIWKYNPFSNKELNLAVGLAFGILIATIGLPFLRNLFDISPMPLSFLWLVVAWAALNLFLVEFAKWLFRLSVRRKKGK